LSLTGKNRNRVRAKSFSFNASAEFKKGQPKNFIPETGIHKIADAFITGEDVPNFVKIITTEEAAKNDFNLSPSRTSALPRIKLWGDSRNCDGVEEPGTEGNKSYEGTSWNSPATEPIMNGEAALREAVA